MKLYMTYRSPYARAVRAALHEKGISFENVSIDFSDKPEEFINTCPAGTVPALKINDGLVLGDSYTILQYIDGQYAKPALMPKEDLLKWQAWEWVSLANAMCDEQVKVFFENKKEEPNQDVLDRADAITNRIVKKLIIALEAKADHSDPVTPKIQYIMGEYSLADIMFGAVMDWMSFRLDKNWHEVDEILVSWLELLKERESFQKTAPSLD
jgi:glutathione S-transferase